MNRLALVVASVGLASSAFAQQGDYPLTPIAPAGQPTAEPSDAAAKKAKRPVLYDEKADAQTQITAALKRAKKENKRVLIQWGFNTCHWCQLMHATFQSDKAIKKELNYEYELVLIDSGGIEGKNMDIAAQFGADVAKEGFPYLTVMDADGRVLANQETSSLELKTAKGESVTGEGAGHDPAKLLAFLKAHEATPLNADSVLADAKARAKTEGKAVFLHFGAPWCTWCHKLDAWLARPEVAAAFGKDFVEVKIDQDRMIGGKDLMTHFKKEPAGIPWFAIIDPATGAAISTSDAADGNIGFPASKEEIAHFVKMLDDAKKNLTSEDIEALKKSLEGGK